LVDELERKKKKKGGWRLAEIHYPDSIEALIYFLLGREGREKREAEKGADPMPQHLSYQASIALRAGGKKDTTTSFHEMKGGRKGGCRLREEASSRKTLDGFIVPREGEKKKGGRGLPWLTGLPGLPPRDRRDRASLVVDGR